MQIKVKQRIVGAAVLVLFLLPTLMIVLYHQFSPSKLSQPKTISLVQKPLGSSSSNVRDLNVHTVQLQLPESNSKKSAPLASGSALNEKTTTEADKRGQLLQAKSLKTVSSTTSTSGVDVAPVSLEKASLAMSTDVAVAKGPVNALNSSVQTPVSEANKTASTNKLKSKSASTVVARAAAGQKSSVMKKNDSTDLAAASSLASDPVAVARDQVLKSSLVGVSANQAWVLQVASFSNKANSQLLLSKLRHAGFHAYSRQATSQGQTVNQVFVGPEVQFAKMQSIQTQLEKQFKLNGLIRRYKL